VTKAVAAGDLSKKITVDVKGEILELKNTVNTMVDQLSSFAAEVTRVAREVGTEGKLGGQAQVEGVSGTWRGLTENVNFMAANLTSQVRGIAKVVTAVANGDLRLKLTVEAKGEIAELADTINGMIDTLATFADQVTSVAREVGVDGELGGQARVPGAAGTWKDLTDNVNQLAANLTTQVRAIAEVATAVTKGDLTQSIKVEAQGEVAALSDNINEMIRNLKDTTLKNSEQDWLKTNLAKFSRMLQGQKDLLTVAQLILSELAPVVNAQHAVFYILKAAEGPAKLTLLASYAHARPGSVADEFYLGEGLVGQCALERQKIALGSVPPSYIRISSGLGHAEPVNLIVLPVIFEGQVKAVLELASFERFNPTHHAFLDQLMESIGVVINTIEANMRTEDLLAQSQSLTRQLQGRGEELQKTNEELQEKAQLLAHQNMEVEKKNAEVEHARKALEEKAEQLALTSKYKSEFLANMSHELRTPLNSLLILSDQLSKNPEGNLTPKQTEFAKTIHSSGTDLLMLINDILDLSKIESGTVGVDISELRIADLQSYVERTFRHVAESKGLEFQIDADPTVSRAIFTDAKRLQQVIKNLLSNAFKFTREGRVSLTIEPAWQGGEGAGPSDAMIAFSVSDTGIGIPSDKQQIIFEAFQQADGSTSRKYGGTGLGLAISREIARLLGGEIQLVSAPGRGSRFTLCLPPAYTPASPTRRFPASARLPERMAVEVSEAPVAVDPRPVELANEVGDDRDAIQPGDLTLLIVENDVAFAKLVADAAHEAGFKTLVTGFGTAALALSRQYRPAAITLDISLPDIDGWRVLERLKNDFTTRQIPVKVITTGEDVSHGWRLGTWSTLGKPISTRGALVEAIRGLRDYVERPVKSLVLVQEDGPGREALLELLALEDVRITAVPTLAAVDAPGRPRSDCLIVGPDVPDAELDTFLDELGRADGEARPPLIVYGRAPLSESIESKVKRLTREMTVKVVSSPERLLDQCALLLHFPVSAMPTRQRQILHDLHESDRVLAGKKALIVDDDIRNIFALTSILERHGMTIISAETGRSAIDLLEKRPDVEVVLMDVMMPEMDGFETMRVIRQDGRFKQLPIIAVTAKAMKGDREKCIEAGAWDYLSKPVDTDELVSMLRAWLVR
jgi:signal transduction histidine kinase/DNA-binding response OmpR family regulator/HAMP domain-containing protein